MKKLFALVLLSLVALCCAPHVEPPPMVSAAPLPKAPSVSAWEHTLHVDTDFDERGRAHIVSAAQKIRRMTRNRVRLDMVFDLDFSSVQNLREHRDAHHSVVIGVLSSFPITQRIDEHVGRPGATPVGATTPLDDGSFAVFLIMDRIEPGDFESIVMHELGHVIGFPDLEIFGAVMSGAQIRGIPVPKDFTPADVELCRRFGYCS